MPKKKPAIKEAPSTGPKGPWHPNSVIPKAQRDYMDFVYEGALAVVKKHGIKPQSDEQRPAIRKSKTAGKVAGPRVAAAPDPAIIEWVKKNGAKYPLTTHLVRAIAVEFRDAHVNVIRACLPDLNPSTVGIQVGKARKG